jgi:hypothetical protein
MKRKYFIISFPASCLFIVLFSNSLYAQDELKRYSISFADKKMDTVFISQSKNTYLDVELVASKTDDVHFKDYAITLSIHAPGLPDDYASFISAEKNMKFTDLKTNEPNVFTIKIKREAEALRLSQAVKIRVSFSILDSIGEDGGAANADNVKKELEFVIQPSSEPLHSYKYLGYLGTNFDLVDGIQAKNIFFATNIFVPERSKWGFVLGVYGNRTLTKTDSSRQTIFLSKIVKINEDSVANYYDTALNVVTRVSDNIGINFLPLIPIRTISDGDLKIYYAPQFEFIWRRTSLESAYIDNLNVRVDTIKRTYPSGVLFPLITPLSLKNSFNVYDVYLGLLGTLIRYENEDISIRINASVGLNLNYIPQGSSKSTFSTGASPVYPVLEKAKRYFFYGRLWITEPLTGLTLGAELSNYFGNRIVNGAKVSNAQPYYNVTLSKAFNLKSLAGILNPLTTR